MKIHINLFSIHNGKTTLFVSYLTFKSAVLILTFYIISVPHALVRKLKLEFSLAQKLPWTIHLEFDWDKDSENLICEHISQCFLNKVRGPDPFEFFPKCAWIFDSTSLMDFDGVGLGWTLGISIFRKRKKRRKGEKV